MLTCCLAGMAHESLVTWHQDMYRYRHGDHETTATKSSADTVFLIPKAVNYSRKKKKAVNQHWPPVIKQHTQPCGGATGWGWPVTTLAVDFARITLFYAKISIRSCSFSLSDQLIKILVPFRRLSVHGPRQIPQIQARRRWHCVATASKSECHSRDPRSRLSYSPPWPLTWAFYAPKMAPFRPVLGRALLL